MAQKFNTTISRRQPWVSVVLGILFIVLGVWCIFTPLATILALTFLFIAGFFVAGIFEIVSAFANKDNHNWGWRLTAGILNLVLAVWLCLLPASQGADVMILVVGFYLCFYSAMGIAESCQLKKYGYGSWIWTLIMSIIGLLCAIGILFSSFFGAIYITLLVGIGFICYGIYRCWV